MILTEKESAILQALYDYNHIPLFLLNESFKVGGYYLYNCKKSVLSVLTKHIEGLCSHIADADYEILCFEQEIYYLFSFMRDETRCYVLGGPMLLESCCHLSKMRRLSFSSLLSSSDLTALVTHLPVVSFSSFSSFLRVTMLLFKDHAPSLEEIRQSKLSNLAGFVSRTFTHELFENKEEYRSHTPYREELAVLSCIREGDIRKLKSTYASLPAIRYGNMSSNPLHQLFYGCIANTTLITRYAIEGGVDEETAFTLSDVYIKQMEQCRTLFELNVVNEKMAIDFTERVAKAKATNSHAYKKPVKDCMDYIKKNLQTKLTLSVLAKETGLTPKYLSFLFCRETGTTISSYIEHARIQSAKELLANSDYSYSKIAHSLNFSSQSYFIAVFKKQTNMTPKEYRLHHRPENKESNTFPLQNGVR